MHAYEKIYEFAASLGSLEGYVYGKRSVLDLDLAALDNWSGNIVEAHRHLPEPVKASLKDPCHQTAGRAIRSLEPVLGGDHPIVRRLWTLIIPGTPLPESADAFHKQKWFTHET